MVSDQPRVFDVSGEGIYEHRVGDERCCTSWCDGGHGKGYPRRCECGGLIHADFGDENMDCDYWLYKKCDQCGETS